MDDIPCAPQAEELRIAYSELDSYFDEFSQLKKNADWNRIVALGEAAIQEAVRQQRWIDEATIHAQLASRSIIREIIKKRWRTPTVVEL